MGKAAIKTATKTTTSVETAVPAGTEMDIPVSLVVADDDFNARKDLNSKGDEGHSIKGLATSIKEEGQLSPVLVAVVKEYPGKYFLVSGFRRFYSISRSKKDGGLELGKIRATVYQPTDKKGNPVELEIKDLYYLNLIENEARKALNPYERAVRYHELVRKHGETGNAIAKRVTLDPSYVNRLIAAMDMHPKLIEQWAEEWTDAYEGTKIMTTDTINKLVKMKKDGSDKQDHESQLAWLDSQLNPPEESDEEGEGTEGNGTNGHDKRASLAQVKRALVAAQLAYKEAKNTGEQSRAQGVIDALKFAIKPQKIAGVLTLKDGGKQIIGVDGKAVIAERA